LTKRLRMTVVYEFDYYGEVDDIVAIQLVNDFTKDPTSFLHPDEPQWDETLIIDIEDITDEGE